MATTTLKMLVSQPEPSSGRSPYHEIASRFGYEVEFKQLIQTVPLEPTEFRKQRIDPLKHTAIVFTSKTIIDCFFELVKSLRITIPETMKFFCSNEAVALYLQKYIVYRKRKVFYGTTGRLAELVELMGKGNHSKEKFFVPVSEDHTDALPILLGETKLHFSECVVYRTITREMDEPLQDHYDLIIFFSPYGIHAIQELLPSFTQGNRVIAAFGELTSKAVEAAGWRLDISYTQSTEHYSSMAGAVEYYLSQHASAKK